MTFQVPELPFALDALEPHISRETLEYHYGKHHQAYAKNLNKMLPGTKFEGSSLKEIIAGAEGGLFNNAAQVWNHSFYWDCLSPDGGGPATGAIADAIDKEWGSFAAFKEAFSDAAMGNFGSGWTWLVKEASGKLAIVSTANAGTPLADSSSVPLLTVDVWEHAYYIDYRNARGDYLQAFWALVNWEFVNRNFS